MKSDSHLIDQAVSSSRQIKQQLDMLRSLDGARNPGASFEETRLAISLVEDLKISLKTLRARFDSRISFAARKARTA